MLTLALDQWTKYLASTILRRLESFSLISGVFELRYLENRGAAFGIMQNRQIVFVVGGIIILAVILYLYQKMPFTPHYRPLRICAVLLASGAVGNMIDRVKLDYVVDFFYFRLIDFPIFNVADCYVVIACILFIVLILFYYKDDNDFEFLNFKNR
ncbi:MAG: signal peptidase II [Clostridiales bacterium 41_21_two_genomes]|nr:MAG: signal peptidase II [Clostridiales bacterium 41_21_two_genomes]